MTLPYSNQTTSKDAAAAALARGSAERQRDQIWEYLYTAGPKTRLELTEDLEMLWNAVNPRVVELVDSGRVVELEETRSHKAQGRGDGHLLAAVEPGREVKLARGCSWEEAVLLFTKSGAPRTWAGLASWMDENFRQPRFKKPQPEVTP